MNLDFHELSGIEQVFTIAFIVAVFISIVSGLIVHSNAIKLKGKDALLNEMLGGLDVFVTDKYLNERGKRWRQPFIISILYILLWLGYFMTFK